MAVSAAVLTAVLSACASSPTPRQPVGGNFGALAAQHAARMVGAPYRYGGTTPRGFDCSGLVYYSYARAGVSVPRTTNAQRKHSRALHRRELRPGDLLFFNQEGKRGSHVGVYIGSSRFVHAPSTGRTVNMASFTDPYWQRHFFEARRFTFAD
jgi:murein DD-endopeptidase